MVATVAYDAYRFTCISNGWWTDFIPVIGQLVFDDPSASPFWGYLYRYLGDGGAMGITFALLPWRTKRIGIAFAIAIYFCLMGTLMLAPGAQEALFPLTPLTAALAMGGHLIYGSVLEWGIQRWGTPSSGVIAPPMPGLNGAQATLPTARTNPRPRVVIVGAGFGGLSAAYTLGNRDVDVLVLSRTNYHGFWPMLYQVATAEVQPEAIAYPVRGVLRRYHNADFRLTEVTGVDLQRKLVLTDGATVAYDYLILAAGSTTNYFGNDQLREQTLPMRDLDEAQRLRDHMLLQVEQAAQELDPAKRAALLTFVVVGGGPTGVELAGALADLIRQTLRKDYPSLDVSQARVVLVEASDCILKTFPAELRAEARQRLEKMGVEVRVNTGVRQAAGNIVTFQNDATLPAHTVVWAAGVRAAALTDALNVTLGQGARVKVAPTLNLPDHPNVFVIGDMAFLESPGGGAYPMLAQVAIQMGKQAAGNILAQTRGRAQKPFRYFDVGQMAIIGPGAAICNSFGLRLRGGSAWLLWLSVHLANLCGRRNRLLTLIHWLSTSVTTDRGARVVTRVER
jgi:NADH dehydrogenase